MIIQKISRGDTFLERCHLCGQQLLFFHHIFVNLQANQIAIYLQPLNEKYGWKIKKPAVSGSGD
jgi:hypothetical protein